MRSGPVAAAVVAACALTGVGLAAPAAAVAPPPAAVSFTVDGLTYTWTAPDGSDMSVRAAPGAPDTPVPAAAGSAAAPGVRFLGAPAVPTTDYCTSSPDSFLGADFRPACAGHDACYSPAGSTARLVCDEAFLVDLRAACAVAFGPAGALALACRAAAVVYHRAVRTVSRPWYRAAGDPA
ncbi:phospholipase A2 [Kineococcus sp. SYSU DK004]|uniref:phospholipase A2 n=1 Tax=Kineococcus sp. SYSU DK004 TaxID=3383125 RepID=UPI003D7F10D2